jgi:hypothetical protein
MTDITDRRINSLQLILIIPAPAWVHMSNIEAGHPARAKMENSDEKDVRCGADRIEP